MKLIVPHTGEVHAADARLIRLAEFLGVHCEPLRLAKEVQQCAEYIEKVVPAQNSCLVINPQIMREWAGGDALSAEVVSSLVMRFSHVLMHALTLDPFVSGMVAAASGGKLQFVQPIAEVGQPYEISSNSKDICGPFAGLTFGPINATNDRVLAGCSDDQAVRTLISIDGCPNMAVVKRDQTEILFLASKDTADVNAEIGCESLRDYFSRLMPHAMALRHIFGEECWRPSIQSASIIIDDPLLRRDYGYLNFESLLHLMEEYNFHTTISFIPHNYRRNSARIIRMFQENAHRLSICFHGNDHTEAELGSTDTALLSRILAIAEERMQLHEQMTGLHCDQVMVFPQDKYSLEAMEILKSRNFHAACSSPNPAGKPLPLRLADFAQPAVLRYGGLPLFVRNFITEMQSQDIAFNLFFGKPILIGEHHDIFRQPGPLLEVVQKINSMAPGISWANLENIVVNATLKRRMPGGTVKVRPFSRNVLIANDSASVERFSIEWDQAGQSSLNAQVLSGSTQFPEVEFGDDGIRILAELPPGATQIFSVLYRNDYPALGNPGFMWDAKAFLRRRLSEIRDNHLSKHQHVLMVAKALKRRFLE